MTRAPTPDTDQLLERVRGGDRSAVDQLFARHRQRLRRMVAVRMDERLSARVDPSDVVQDALIAASRQLDEYLGRPGAPFYPWLRQIAWNRLVDLYRRHIQAGRRTVTREERLGLSNTSAVQLAERLLGGGLNPVSQAMRKELQARVKATLARLNAIDQEILVLRHLEQLPLSQCGEVLGISDETAKKRYVRAVRRLRQLLDDGNSGATQ